MKLGVRTRVFLAVLVLATAVGLPAGILLEIRLRQQLVGGIEADLYRDAAALETHLAAAGGDPDEAVDALARALEVRLTAMKPDGTVFADSERDGDDLLAMDDHSSRPEVSEALETGRGVATRRSTTLETDQLYVALRSEGPDGTRAVLRASTPLSQVERALWQLRVSLFLGGGLALVLAAASGGLISGWMQRTLERLVERARTLSDDQRPLVPRASMAELGRRLEEALQDLAAERDQHAAVLDGVADAVFAVDGDLRVTLVNPAARRLLAARPVGRPLAEMSRSEALVDLVRRGVASQSPEVLELSWPGPPARELEVVAAPLHALDGCVVVVHDLTEVRSLERVRRDFVANVSHELRTPIAVIAATTETLMDGAIDDPETARDFVEAVRRHAVRVGNLVQDLLSLSRIEAGRVPIDLQPLSVLELARHAATLVQDQHPERAAVRVQVPDALRVLADRGALDHVIGNLVENAARYTSSDTPITLRAWSAGSRVILEVADEGPGIPPEHMGRIFERFYRVDAGRSRAVGGTGLGLSIVRHLVDALGGTVDLRANVPSGCVFRLDLPAPRDEIGPPGAPGPREASDPGE